MACWHSSQDQLTDFCALPIAILLLLGVVVAVGGVFVVRQQFLKEGKSGKTAYDEAKIAEQAKNPQELPKIEEEPKGELVTAPFVYQPTTTKATVSAEPAWSITAPSGWENTGGGPGYKVRFRATSEDREDQEGGLYAAARAQISIAVGPTGGKTLADYASYARKTIPSPFESMDVLSEKKTIFAGQEAVRFEVELKNKGVRMRTLDYFFAKDGYIFHIGTSALAKYWDQREFTINSSLATFKFL